MRTSPYNTSSSSKTKSQSQSFSSSYPESQTPSTSCSSAAQRFHSQQQLSFVVGGKSYLFPAIFGVYRDGSTKLVLSEHHITTPFMIIATSNHSDKPSITVSSPTAIMGTVKFHDSSSKTDIVVGNTSSTLQSSGLLSPVWDFTYTFDNGLQEAFRWKKSSGEAVAGLNGRSRGSKLVRVSTGEVLAAWSQPATTNLDKVAKIGLLDSGRAHGWGERWEVTVVLGAVALIEKDRRIRDDASAAALGQIRRVLFADRGVDGRMEGFEALSEIDGVVQGEYDHEAYHGAPVAIQIIGRRLTEERILEIAEEIGRLLGNEIVS